MKNDDYIINLFGNRSEKAIEEIDKRYYKLCFGIALLLSLSLMIMTFPVYAQDSFNDSSDIGIQGLDKKALSPNYEKIKLNQVDRKIIPIDDTVYWEIEDYSDLDAVVLATTRVEKARHLYLRRTSDSEVMVQWSLHGVFTYNGTTSQCIDVWMNAYNFNETDYTITNKSYSRSGMWAIGNCGAVNKRTTKSYSNTIRIGVQPNGTVLTP